MQAAIDGEHMLTELDFSRLTALLSRQLTPPLADLLSSAEITSSRAVDLDVVTRNSRVELVDVGTHRRQVLTVVYPGDAEPAAGFISVLSPVGIGLLGPKAGDVAKWSMPHGEECGAEVVAILFQPEATGDYAT